MAKAKMRSLSFDDGYESFMVNDDPERVIRFNPADPEILNRALNVKKVFESYEVPEGIELNQDGTPKDDMEVSATYVAEMTGAMRKAFNDIFLSDVYDTIFAGQSPLCIPKDKYMFEGVLDGLIELMKPAVEEYARKNNEKMKKYLEDVDK